MRSEAGAVRKNCERPHVSAMQVTIEVLRQRVARTTSGEPDGETVQLPNLGAGQRFATSACFGTKAAKANFAHLGAGRVCR